jgi:hypothetical protein
MIIINLNWFLMNNEKYGPFNWNMLIIFIKNNYNVFVNNIHYFHKSSKDRYICII